MGLNWRAGDEPIAGYRLIERMGGGGFGEVWKAEAPGGFLVALKGVSLVDAIGMDAKAGKVELRSLDVIRKLRHPQLVSISGTWQADHTLIIAMELADKTLLDRFREAAGQGFAGIPEPEIHELFFDAARGLDFLNEPRHAVEGSGPHGIQHRDIKPQNLLLMGGSLKVADYGLARVLAETQVSHTGSMTPLYAAPEFFRGKTSSHSDQYSLAATYCHMRGGRPPFSGMPYELMMAHLNGEPDLSMLPESERPAVARALSKDPKDRWPTCRKFIEATRAAAPPEAASSTPPLRGQAHPSTAGASPTEASPTTRAAAPSELPRRPRLRAAGGSREIPWPSGADLPHRRRRPWVIGAITAPMVLVLTVSIAILSSRMGGGGGPRDDARPNPPQPAGDPVPPAVSVETPVAIPKPVPPPVPAPSNPIPSFTIEAPGTISIGRGETKPLVVQAIRTAYDGPIRVKVHGLPEGLTPAEATIPDSQSRASIAIAIPPDAPQGDYRLAILARGGDLSADAPAILTVTDTAISHLERGKRLYFENEFEKSIDALTEAIRLDPNLAIAYNGRGLARYHQKEYERAIEDFNEAIRLDPKLAPAYTNRGLAWWARKEYGKAIEDHDEAIRLDPKLTSAYDGRGLVRYDQKEYDRAIADFSEAIRLDPKHVPAINNRGLAWRAQKEYGRAIEDFDEAIRLDPKLALAYNGRGGAWGLQKDYGKAIADFSEAIRLNPNDPQPFSNRAIAYRAQGDTKRAEADEAEAQKLKGGIK